MKRVLDVVSGREIPGRDKRAWTRHGIVVITEDGRMSIKLESIPVGEWDGWLQIFEKKDRDAADGPTTVGDGVPF